MMHLSDLESGSSIFIDANIFIYHFSKESKFNLASSDFLERVENGDVYGFTSIPVVQEVTHRMMIIEAAATFPGIKPKDLVKYLKKHPEAVQKLVTHQDIPGKIRSFNLEIVSPDIETLVRSQLLKGKYGFLSNDALSVQILKDMSIGNLATNDSDFERVDFIKVYKPAVSIL